MIPKVLKISIVLLTIFIENYLSPLIVEVLKRFQRKVYRCYATLPIVTIVIILTRFVEQHLLDSSHNFLIAQGY